MQRRQLVKGLVSAGMIGAAPSIAFPAAAMQAATPEVTDFALVSSYNNYYEFSTNKKMVKHIAKDFITRPWQLTIKGLVDNPITLDLENLLDISQVNRVYKLRCVEGWSAVIPWQGIELATLLALANPLKTAKYVKFDSKYDPSQMIGQRHQVLPWPYSEGLRLDEARHPLTILATGMYGQSLTKQNGAPIRLVVPWKYGYKSIKAVTSIELVKEQPVSSWQQQAPSEYGFYGNVNPQIPHPRWSQRREVSLGQTKKIRTELLNGYASEVRSLYTADALNSLF